MKLFERNRDRPLYDGSVWKVMILASALIVLSTSLIGVLSYRITKQEVVKKLKTSDLALMARSIANQVEGRIDRALETSRQLADNPAVLEWVTGGEKDAELGGFVLRQLKDLPPQYDYTNSFVASAVTRQYWAESGGVLYTLSESNPDDVWFFDTLSAGRKANVVVDTDPNRKDTFVFVNVLIGDEKQPLGIAGVGLSLEKLSRDFASYNFVKGSRLWMVGRDGTIHLSDDFDFTGTKLADHLTATALEEWNRSGETAERVFEAEDRSGRKIDMISYPIPSAGMRLLVQIPRSSTLGFLDSIQVNTSVVVVLSLVITVFFFTYVSRKMANPYKRALRLNEELDKMVKDRTKELADKNKEMTESIEYANRIQQSVLPSEGVLRQHFSEYLAFWRPRDLVGGDFYWVKQVGDVKWVAVGDCTGHGVPGALMTMLSVSLLNRIADLGGNATPAAVLRRLNVLLKETLHQNETNGQSDDGLDLGLVFIRDDEVVYAGAGIFMIVRDRAGSRIFKGDKHRIGYRRTPDETEYTDHTIRMDDTAAIYMASDGIPDQNGGAKNLSMGKTQLVNWLASYGDLPLSEQQTRFEQELDRFMGTEPQRDDMTLLAFKLTAGANGKGGESDGQTEQGLRGISRGATDAAERPA